MRGREDRERAAAGFENRQAVARAQAHGILVDGAAEAVVLPAARGIAPHQPRVVVHAEALQSADVFVRHRGLRRRGHHFLAQQVGAAINGVLERAGEDAGRESRERDLQARALRLHLAGAGVVSGPGAADLVRLTRQIEVGAVASRDHERRIPEGVPLFALDHFGRQRDAEFAQRRHLLLREAPHAAGNLKLGGEVRAQDDPRAAGLARRQFLDYRLPVADGELCPQLLTEVSIPGHLQHAGAELRFQAVLRPVAGHVAIELRGGGGGENEIPN